MEVAILPVLAAGGEKFQQHFCYLVFWESDVTVIADFAAKTGLYKQFF